MKTRIIDFVGATVHTSTPTPTCHTYGHILAPLACEAALNAMLNHEDVSLSSLSGLGPSIPCPPSTQNAHTRALQSSKYGWEYPRVS